MTCCRNIHQLTVNYITFSSFPKFIILSFPLKRKPDVISSIPEPLSTCWKPFLWWSQMSHLNRFTFHPMDREWDRHFALQTVRSGCTVMCWRVVCFHETGLVEKIDPVREMPSHRFSRISKSVSSYFPTMPSISTEGSKENWVEILIWNNYAYACLPFTLATVRWQGVVKTALPRHRAEFKFYFSFCVLTFPGFATMEEARYCC